MASCGCTLESYRCVVGGELMAQLFMLVEAIESPLFSTLSEAERSQIGKEYDKLWAEYIAHCGCIVCGSSMQVGYSRCKRAFLCLSCAESQGV